MEDMAAGQDAELEVQPVEPVVVVGFNDFFCLTPQEMIQFNLHVQNGERGKDSSTLKKNTCHFLLKKTISYEDMCAFFFLGGGLGCVFDVFSISLAEVEIRETLGVQFWESKLRIPSFPTCTPSRTMHVSRYGIFHSLRKFPTFSHSADVYGRCR